MRKRPLCAFILCFLLFEAVYAGWSEFTGNGISPADSLGSDGSRITCVGVVGRREETADGHIYYLKQVQTAPNQEQISSMLLIYDQRNEIQIGNCIQVTGKLKFFETATSPGMFDQEFYYRKQNIAASVWAEEVQVLDDRKAVFGEFLTEQRMSWKREIVQALGEQAGNALCAVLLGEKKGLDPEWKEAYQQSGIGHILAISGLHMSFLGMGLYQLLRKRGVPFIPAGILGCLFLSAYAVMVGSGVSSIRALVMYMVRMGAEMTGRTYDTSTSLALAAFVLVLKEPLYLMDAGFLLSFGAILGILLIQPVVKELWGQRTLVFPLAALRDGFLAGLSINLMLFPVLLYYYFEVSPYSLLLNLLVIPTMSWVLGAGFIGLLLTMTGKGLISAAGIPGQWLLKSSGKLLELYGYIGRFTLKLPGARLILGRPKVWQIAGYYLLLLSVEAVYLKYKSLKTSGGEENRRINRTCRGNFNRRRVQALSTGLLLAAVALCFAGHGTGGKLEIIMLDVGQGDGMILRFPNGINCLVDGGSSDVSGVGQYRLEAGLKSLGISGVDYVFISHGDQDHNSGVLEMLERKERSVRIKTLVLPCRSVWDENLQALAEAAWENGARVATMEAGEMLEQGEVRLTCLQPGEGDLLVPGNAASMVLALNYRDFDLLLTGDVEADGESLLEERLESVAHGTSYDVLKVAHHGSRNSSGELFLEKVSPRCALISAGKGNLYGHPHEETLERLGAAGCKVYNTQTDGAITIQTDGQRMYVRTMIQERKSAKTE